MAMTIMNDASAAMTLGELNKNISQLGKQLKKVSSGMKINSAGDDASGYSISEKMRVRIRALDQDERNVQNGAALLRVAEGGVQQQIEIMKTIKEKVLDAANDTNTDIDRATIQKEIDQGYRQLDTIAQETTYNGKRLLVGNAVDDVVETWLVKTTSELVEGSDAMNLVENQYDTLDGMTGPFAAFSKSEIKKASAETAGFSPTIAFEGGTNGTSATYTFTLGSSITSVDDLDGKGFYASGYYVLTKTPDSSHRYGVVSSDNSSASTYSVTEIDISGCGSVEDVMELIDTKISSVTGHTANTLTSTSQISGQSWTAKSGTTTGRAAVAGTGVVGSGEFLGGKNASGVDDDDPDTPPYEPATKATFTMSGVSADTGIALNGYYLKFVSGSGGRSSSATNGVYTVGVDYSGSFSFGSCTVAMNGGSLTFTANTAGTSGNSYRVTDGIPAVSPVTYNYQAAASLAGTSSSSGGSSAAPAYATVDVSGYSDVEDLIGDFTGKAITVGYSGYGNSDYFAQGFPYDSNRSGTSTYTYYNYYEFLDSASGNPIDNMQKINGSTTIDLNTLRTAVAGGKTIGQAFSDLLVGKNSRFAAAKNGDDQTVGIKVRSYSSGTSGNSEKLWLTQNNLRSYSLDYGSWFANNPGVSIPEYLDEKGFRAYCATDDSQWFNFYFTTGDDPDDVRPEADPDAEDIKTMFIDVSGVTDAASLVQAIKTQADEKLLGSDPDYNHHMRLIADTNNGVLTIYDQRLNTDSYLKNVKDASGNLLYHYQEEGAKIADGVQDNVLKDKRNIYVQELVIQHTDHASQNIRLKVPQTTLDHLYGYKKENFQPSDFHVLTKESRDALLGSTKPPVEGYLDKALDYLTGANTLIGAQIMRLGMTENNIVTSRESTQFSESTIRDADMAKEMTGYTKANVLAQAAQSMLAQANQNSSAVLGLLQ